MEAYESVLMELGLSPKESRVYLALLKEGPSSVRQLASATGINRGTVFDMLKALQTNGLARFYNEKTRQYFVAAPPEKLRELGEERAEAVNKANSQLEDVVPALESLYNSGDKHPAVRMYEGMEGVRTILEDILETMVSWQGPKEYYVYSSSAVRDAGLYAAFPDYTEHRIEAGIAVKTISLGPGGTTAGLDERKWIPAIEGVPTYSLIYGGRVAHIFLGKSELMGIIIENRGIFDTQKILFMELWNRLDVT